MSEKKGKDPLDDIFVDENIPADKKILANILKPYVTIDTKGVIAYTDRYYKIEEMKKVLIYLLCKKAMVLKGIKDIEEKAQIKEVVEKAHVSESTAKNALFTRLKNIVKEGKIPNHCLSKVKELLIEKDGQ